MRILSFGDVSINTGRRLFQLENDILKDCISMGLTIFWFKYNIKEEIPKELIDKVNFVNNLETPIDSTERCATMVEELLWKELSEE